MKVVEIDGQWWVCSQTYGPFATNAEAWRFLDRAMGEPINKREDTVEWINRKE